MDCMLNKLNKNAVNNNWIFFIEVHDLGKNLAGHKNLVIMTPLTDRVKERSNISNGL